ncbi:hypothetical protein GWK47_041224 [Chionoecetes opilio]|uniref:Uncharacterized protein n=1 Tax=Chionoecetes opilio TaxID=41210 RepID=A0A8J4YH82_CHIOP|nr:hypothetical protein GWK47_041224 [Chionoecetes opilio]
MMTFLTTTTTTITTMATPNITDDSGGSGPYPDGGVEVDLVAWVIMGGSVLCLVSVVLGYVFLVLLPRRGYTRLKAKGESRRKQMTAITQLLEEARGRPRRVEAEESLTQSERHFLVHDFADFP